MVAGTLQRETGYRLAQAGASSGAPWLSGTVGKATVGPPRDDWVYQR